MAISGKIKIWTGEQCDYCGRAAHNCQSWAINWLAHWSLQEGIENRCPKTEDRTRTRRSWHNILEACSGCQHFMLVVSESQLAVAATATAAEISLRTVRVFPLQKKQVLERRSQNNRTHPNPVVRSFVRAQKTKATTYNTLWHKIGNKIERSMWKSLEVLGTGILLPNAQVLPESLLYFILFLSRFVSLFLALGSFWCIEFAWTKSNFIAQFFCTPRQFLIELRDLENLTFVYAD